MKKYFTKFMMRFCQSAFCPNENNKCLIFFLLSQGYLLGERVDYEHVNVVHSVSYIIVISTNRVDHRQSIANLNF